LLFQLSCQSFLKFLESLESVNQLKKHRFEVMQPLTAEDVADCVLFTATNPSYVNIDAIIVKPLEQVTAYQIHRRNGNK
jgi:NADP-dependent 3-hydroxy acid dehydrogenase YdfG